MVSVNEVEDALAELNIDPTSPEYKSDMWIACKKLGVSLVVTGDYNFEADRYLINAYIYNVKFKLALPDPQAVNIFKSEEAIFESVEIMANTLVPGIK